LDICKFIKIEDTCSRGIRLGAPFITRLFSFPLCLVAYIAWCTVVSDVNAACTESTLFGLYKNELTMLAQVRRYTKKRKISSFS